MPNFEFTSPVYLIFLVLYFITSAITEFDINQERSRLGLLGYESQKIAWQSPPLPKWFLYFSLITNSILIILFILNWKITIIVWIVKLILNRIGFLLFCGALLLLPFRSKRPVTLSEEHLAIAGYIRAYTQISDDQNITRYIKFFPKIDYEGLQNLFYDESIRRLKKLHLTEDDKNLVSDSLDYLGAKQTAKYTAIDIFDNAKEEKRLEIQQQEREEQRQEEEKEWLKEEEELKSFIKLKGEEIEKLKQMSKEEFETFLESQNE